MVKPIAFRNAAAFRAWLRVHHRDTAELVIRLFKTHAAARGMTYPQALDEALCFGWIDGVRHGLDGDSYSVRFTPRRPRSVWSRVNVAHAERLIEAGRMEKPGLDAYRARTDERTGVYSFERSAARFAPALERRLKQDRAAWRFFRAQTPGYRRTCTFWVMSAKKDETRVRRLQTLIDCSARSTWIPAMRRAKPREGRR